MATDIERVHELAEALGFESIGEAPASVLVTREEVRNMCAANKCMAYDHNWSCPPACGSIQDYQAQFDARDVCIIVQSVVELEDEFDVEGMMECERIHKKRLLKLLDQVHEEGIDSMFLAAGCCTLCKECTYPDNPCRMPEKRLTSMEASGLVVSEVCTAAGIPYNHGQNTMCYSSCVII